jgi:amino acid adenylation domain-containing protein
MNDLSKHLSSLSPKKLALLSEQLKKKGEDASKKTITVRPTSEFNNCPLSFAQQRLWFLDQMEGGSETYNVPIALTLNGTIHRNALEQAIGEIVQRHEVLRTTFPIVNGTPVQAICSTSTVNMEVVDLQAFPEQEQYANVERLVIKEQVRPFDLSNGPLLRVTLLRLGEKSHILLVTMHHIVSDGWSMSIFIRELTALYETFSIGEPSPLPELPIQYADFAIWQRQRLQGEVLKTQLNYWKQQLAGAPPLLALPTDRSRPPIQTFRGRTERFEIKSDLTQKLKTVSQNSGATLFMTLLAAFVTLLGRYSNQEDIVVGSLIANRNRSEIESLIGFFINPLVLRTDLKGNPTFSEILTRVQQITLDAYAHQDVPFEQVVEALQPERNLSYNPLFQVMFVLQNTPARKLELPGLSITPLELQNITANYELTLSMEETKSEIIGSIEYNTDLFDEVTIRRMAGHLQTLLAGIVSNPQLHFKELPILTAKEQHLLLEECNNTYSEYPQNQCFHQLFEVQVEKTPDAVAVVFEDEILTYRELNARANRLARLILEQGVSPQTTIALLAFRNINLITAIIAIFKVGCTYLPLDPSYPPQRLCQILAESKAPIVFVGDDLEAISEKMLSSLPPQLQTRVLLLKELLQQECCQKNLAVPASDNYLAYVIYTSGSTGTPKGAMVEHRGMNNHLFAKISDLKLTSNDCVAQTARISFDISIWQFLAALLVGGQVHIFPDPEVLDPAQLLDHICQGITLLEIVPSLLQMMLLEIEYRSSKRPNLSGLRWLLLTGEALPAQLSRQWFKYYCTIPVVNAYGPTECSDDVTHYPIHEPPKPEVLNVPIGRPVANMRLYVLDSQLQPVPLGVAGELYVGGIGVGRGYLNNAKQTASVFLPDPFSQSEGARLYKTGDLGRYLADGNIEFLGRIDSQVKIRGLRIELGEIEALLMQHPQVREAIIIADKERSGEHRLIAYVVPSQETVSTSDLYNFLKQKLPDYMIPSAFVLLDTLPLTSNGKVDRRILSTLNVSTESLVASFVQPRSSLEKTLAAIWANVLRLEKVGIYDNFFNLGGHSLLATQVISRVQEAFSVDLSVRQLFEFPTVAQQGEMIENLLIEKDAVLQPHTIMSVSRETRRIKRSLVITNKIDSSAQDKKEQTELI